MKSEPIRFASITLLVDDLERAKKFYTEILEQNIKDDFGYFIGFHGGFSLWEKDYALKTMYAPEMHALPKNILKPCNFILVAFEHPDIKRITKKLEQYGLEIIHDVYEQPWGQLVIRFRDPEGYLCEIGEPLDKVIQRLFESGLSEKQIIKKTGLSSTFVSSAISKIK
jgi:catechol 2,3-dioxygenase-like lactoylglutathione lyase family enzyme